MKNLVLNCVSVVIRDGFGKSCSGSLTIDDRTGCRVPGAQFDDLCEMNEEQFLSLLRDNYFTWGFAVRAQKVHEIIARREGRPHGHLSEEKDFRGCLRTIVSIIYGAQGPYPL